MLPIENCASNCYQVLPWSIEQNETKKCISSDERIVPRNIVELGYIVERVRDAFSASAKCLLSIIKVDSIRPFDLPLYVITQR